MVNQDDKKYANVYQQYGLKIEESEWREERKVNEKSEKNALSERSKIDCNKYSAVVW